MPLIPTDQNLFVVDLHYVAALDMVEPLLDPHVAFLEQGYAKGWFLASGPKVPRTGGVILATASSRQSLEDWLTKDPFHQAGVAQYTVTEFRPSMQAPALTP